MRVASRGGSISIGGLVPVVLAVGCAAGGEAGGDSAASFGSFGSTAGGSVSGGATDSASGQDSDAPYDPDCVDEDGDSFGPDCAAGPDCDDNDPARNPGAPEQCNNMDDNCDGEADNGCMCADDGVSGDCNLPFDLGTVAAGQRALGVVANIPQQDATDWYQVSFPITERPGEGMPQISFAINESEGFVFDVSTERCASETMVCGEGGQTGQAIGLTDWTFVDDTADCCKPPMDALVPWPSTVFIRVSRTSVGSSCETYQLQISR